MEHICRGGGEVVVALRIQKLMWPPVMAVGKTIGVLAERNEALVRPTEAREQTAGEPQRGSGAAPQKMLGF